MTPLTERQRKVLDFIVAFRDEMGRTPTGPEIAQHFSYSDHSSAYQHLRLLQAKGYIELVQSGTRRPLGIVLREPARLLLERSWPLLGAIPAGPLTEHPTDIREEIRGIDDLLPGIRPGDYFLRVEGDSMIEAGLQPGAYVVVRPGVEPRRGDICAVWIEGEGGTLKRFFPERGKVRLAPANPNYQPHTYPADQVRVQGVLVASLAVREWKSRDSG